MKLELSAGLALVAVTATAQGFVSSCRLLDYAVRISTILDNMIVLRESKI